MGIPLPRAPFKTIDNTTRNRNILGFRSLLFIRSVVYRELRGFDDFAHQEEIDLCWRANKGYSIKYNYKSTVYHVGGATLQQGNRRKHF
jgi:GT2 family glycosyltransferase